MTFRYARKCLGDMSVALICDCANDIVYRAFLGFFVNPDALCQISNGDAHICLQRDTRYKARKQRRESVRNPGDSGEKFGRGFGGTKCLSGTTVIPIGIARPRFTIWSKRLWANSHVACFRMSAQDIWLRKHHELWEKLEDNTKNSFCTALWKWLVPTQLCGKAMHLWC